MSNARTPIKLADFWGKLNLHSPQRYIERYEQAMKSVVAEEVINLDTSHVELDNKIVTRLTDEILSSRDNQAHFEVIRLFIEQFLNDPVNLAATTKSYTDKIMHIDRLITAELNFLNSLHEKLSDYLRKVSQSLPQTAELLDDMEAWHNQFANSLSKYPAVQDIVFDVLFALREQDGNLQQTIQTGINELADILKGCTARKTANLNKIHTIQDPACVSFAVLRNDVTKEVFYLMGVSAPESNEDLLTRLSSFANQHPKFCLAEAASKSFHLFLQGIRELVGADKPRNPLRPCSEKSLISTLAKLKHNHGEQLTIEFIVNFAFYPRDKSQLEEETGYIKINRNDQDEVIKLIPPCADCHMNMPAAQVLLTTPSLCPISPLKKLGQFPALSMLMSSSTPSQQSDSHRPGLTSKKLTFD